MSERPPPELPPASFEITELRRAVAASKPTIRPLLLGIIACVASVGALVLTLLMVARTVTMRQEGDIAILALVAIGVVGTAVLLAVLVILPGQLANRVHARRVAITESVLDAHVDSLRTHLASIGYLVPVDTALDWLVSPEPTATVPLPHESQIAARWWRPAVNDGRVFVEPHLRVGDGRSSLPVLPPIDLRARGS